MIYDLRPFLTLYTNCVECFDREIDGLLIAKLFGQTQAKGRLNVSVEFDKVWGIPRQINHP